MNNRKPACLRDGVSLSVNRFIIKSLIGNGGFSFVYKALDVRNNTVCVLKEIIDHQRCVRLSNGFAIDLLDKSNLFDEKIFERIKKRAREEYEHFKSVRFPFLVTPTALFEENNTIYLVLPYIDGETLATWLHQNGNQVDKKTIIENIFFPVLDAVKCIHEIGLFHRDVKLDNVMVADGKAYLIDTGAAREINTDKQLLTKLVTQGAAPEVMPYLDKYGSPSIRSDVYSLVFMLYYIVVGQPPVSTLARVDADNHRQRDPLGQLSGMSDTQWAFFHKGLSLNSTDRFANTDELKQLINEIFINKKQFVVQDEKITNTKVGVPNTRKIDKQFRIKRVMAFLFTALVSLLIALLANSTIAGLFFLLTQFVLSIVIIKTRKKYSPEMLLPVIGLLFLTKKFRRNRT